MMKILLAFLILATLDTIHTSPDADADELGIKYFIANPMGLDYKFSGKKDEHRFGVELKENKQFHHTKTAEDGVRLGCYGHEQDGKMYSTHYVADGRGYRLVPHQDLITVYPKDGGEPRKASFVQSFNEAEVRSENIRYFFPEGCQSPKIEIERIEVKSNLPKASQGTFNTQKSLSETGTGTGTGTGTAIGTEIGTKTITGIETGTGTGSGTDSGITSPNGAKDKKGRGFDFPPSGKAPSGDTVDGNPAVNQLTETTKSEIPKSTPPNTSGGSPYEKQKIYEDSKSLEIPAGRQPAATLPSGSSSKAKQDSTLTANIGQSTPLGNVESNRLSVTSPKSSSEPLDRRYLPIVDTLTPDTRTSLTPQYRNEAKECSDTCCDDNRPQVLLSRSTPGSCCKGVAKIVIPLPMETLSQISTSEIIEITAETSNILMLEKLLKLVEKYKL